MYKDMTAIAYLRPRGEESGDITLPDRPPVRYHTKLRGVREGFYQTTYSFGKSVIFVNGLGAVPTNTISEIERLVRTLPRLSQRAKDELLAQLKDLGPDDAYEQLTDAGFLETIPGVGRHLARRIADQLGEQSPKERRLMRLLGSYGIHADLSKSWYKWMRGYFEHYRGARTTLSDVADNPYLLFRIQRDRQAKDYLSGEWKLKLGRGLSMDDIDAAVTQADPRWKTHVSRAVEYAYRCLEDARSDGHSVVMQEDVARRLREKGITQVSEAFGAEPVMLTDEHVRRLVARSGTMENVMFNRSDGQPAWGVCLREIKRWHALTVDVLKGLQKAERPISQKEAARCYRKAIEGTEHQPTEEQKAALKNAFHAPVSAITGGAGTGKTVTAQLYLNGVLALRKERLHMDPVSRRQLRRTGHHIYLLAPTGVAAQRLRLGLQLRNEKGDEVVPAKIKHPAMMTANGMDPIRHIKHGDVFIGTLHSFLGYKGGSTYLIPTPHPSFIFVDEYSMVDEELNYHLMRFVHRCIDRGVPVTLLISGDDQQLPPVGVGFPFRDLLGGPYGASIPATRLSVVKRQGVGSMVAHSSAAIRNIQMPPSPQDYASWGIDYNQVDLAWHRPEEVQGMPITQILGNYARYLTSRFGERVSVRDIQVILPLRNQSKVEPDALYTKQLNLDLQQQFAAASGTTPRTYLAQRSEDGEFTYKVLFAGGDKVIHTGENGYDGGAAEPVNRGSIGRILHAEPGYIDVQYAWLDSTVRYKGPEGVGQLDLAYAITGHQSQGSEYDYVYITLPERAGINYRTGDSLVDRNWLYTAITRARRHLMLIASESRIRHAVSISTGMNRNTLLARELLKV